MDNSILLTIKKMLGPSADYKVFDTDIIVNINTTLMVLNQLGIGPKSGFFISSEQEKWEDFIGDFKNLEAIKTYIYLKVKLVFDPPTSSAVLEAMERQAKELEWRLSIRAETYENIAT